jgi:hypothetical protein
MTPDPITPGLLDLLSVAALGSRQQTDDPDEPTVARPPRFAVEGQGGSHRLWVEVEASAR